MVEPVFGNIGTNKRLHRFSFRGKRKVQGQWQLYCLVHNIEMLANYGTGRIDVKRHVKGTACGAQRAQSVVMVNLGE